MYRRTQICTIEITQDRQSTTSASDDPSALICQHTAAREKIMWIKIAVALAATLVAAVLAHVAHDRLRSNCPVVPRHILWATPSAIIVVVVMIGKGIFNQTTACCKDARKSAYDIAAGVTALAYIFVVVFVVAISAACGPIDGASHRALAVSLGFLVVPIVATLFWCKPHEQQLPDV